MGIFEENYVSDNTTRSSCIAKNIIVTIPIREKHQSLIAAAIGANGNNIKSVKSLIMSGLNPKCFFIYIKGCDGEKYWHLTVSISDPVKWKLLEKAHQCLDRHLEFFYKKKNSYNAVLVIQAMWKKFKQNKKTA